MKDRKALGALPYQQPKGKWSKGYVTTAQTHGDTIALDVYKDGVLQGRHCIRTDTGEYAQWDALGGKWNRRKYGNLLGLDMSTYGYCDYGEAKKRAAFGCAGEEDTVRVALAGGMAYRGSTFTLIDRAEGEYARGERERKEFRRLARMKELMARIPAVPEGVRGWIHEREGAQDFAFYDKNKKTWHCTACGAGYAKAGLRTAEGKVAAHNQYATCPGCGKRVQAKTRTGHAEAKSHFLLLQPVDGYMGVARFFDVRLYWDASGRRVQLSEAVRVALYRLGYQPKQSGKVYYNQYTAGGEWDEGEACFDYKRNPANRRTYECFLYPGGIPGALGGTAWQNWAGVFRMLAEGGQRLYYDRLMVLQDDRRVMGLVEMLYKGRFHRLLRETVAGINTWYGMYTGTLDKNEGTLEGVFGIHDRQRIHRIRDADGGKGMVEWMRHEEEAGGRIPQEVLLWLDGNGIRPKDTEFIKGRMSTVQVKNYVLRQQAGGYRGKKEKDILGQWEDYLSMCEKLGKHTDDAMVYRPGDLKLRHDEAVAELEMEHDAEMARREACRMRERFPGAEEVLAEIRGKYGYSNGEYTIRVPGDLMEIMQDSRALHHCAGASDRYFDRIVQRETYICFLRRADAPDTPYYTIEVEPGGTIRQHRGMYDEEPDIEKVLPFLREWQEAIKKRIGEEDMGYARASAIKRQQNIEELAGKGNTRVLKGLMEDFMEAI